MQKMFLHFLTNLPIYDEYQTSVIVALLRFTAKFMYHKG